MQTSEELHKELNEKIKKIIPSIHNVRITSTSIYVEYINLFDTQPILDLTKRMGYSTKKLPTPKDKKHLSGFKGHMVTGVYNK